MSLAISVCIALASHFGQGAECDKIGISLESLENHYSQDVIIKNACKLYLYQNKNLLPKFSCDKLLKEIKRQQRNKSD